jgi:hypothetical protein
MAGPYTDAKPRARGAGYANITLDWWTAQPAVSATGCTTTCLGWELDLQVKAPSGAYYYYGNNGDLYGPPYIMFPRDSYDDLIPMETVVIGPAAANGVYKVFADRGYSVNPSWTNSLAGV